MRTIFAALMIFATTAVAADPSVTPFAGKMAKTVAESTPAFPPTVRAPAGAPNVILVLTDDVGFSAASTFGGPIATPHLDKLAARGLKFTNFHTTAICSPTRAALLTGRNHHAVSTGILVELSAGYPGYWTTIPKSAATVGRVLKDAGYSTAFYGKHHNVPMGQMSQAGPFDLWPTGLGFDYFYGFIGGDSDQWNPTIYRGTSLLENESHHDQTLDASMADDAIRWVHNQQGADSTKPFFIYFAPGTAHAPHHAPKDWIAKFHGQFDQGWDKVRGETYQRQLKSGVIPAGTKISPRPAEIPAWDSLTPDQKRLYARYMEVYAGMLAYQDEQLGRLFDEIERMGEIDNTLIMFVEGDNGASGEGSPAGTVNELNTILTQNAAAQGWMLEIIDELGGPKTYEHYPAGWAWATTTPFPWMKQVASHRGGITNGLVVSWPAKIQKPGGTRTQFTHVIDVMPTILEATGIPQPEAVDGVKQQRMDGVSFFYALNAPKAPERHTTQYFEMVGNRGIYHDGWFANTRPARMPWTGSPPDSVSTESYEWELYDLRKDYSQSQNLAQKDPARLKELQAVFDAEAWKNNVYPIDHRFGLDRTMAGAARSPYGRVTSFTYWGPGISLSRDVAPNLWGRSFSLSADIVVPKDGANGVLLAYGSHMGGWGFYLHDGKPVAVSARSQIPGDRFRISANAALKPGPATVRYDFDYDGGGLGKGGLLRISVGGQEVARGRVEHTGIMGIGLNETMDTGRDTGAPISTDDYKDLGVFSGEIRKITVDLGPFGTNQPPVKTAAK